MASVTPLPKLAQPLSKTLRDSINNLLGIAFIKIEKID
jgi:hypothetical protein